MPTLDEMRDQRDLFEIERRRGLRPNSRPTIVLANNGKTCKTCKYATALHYAGTYYKCELNRGRWTQGLATDIRLKDPACELYDEGLDETRRN